MNVKKFIAITTICAAMLCSGTYIAAAAEDSGITVPESFTVDFTLDNVDDYTVTDGQYALADGKNIYLYNVNAADSSGYDYDGGEVITYEHSSAVTTLEYSDGVLYFSDGSQTYIYSDGAATAVEAAEEQFTFTEFSDTKRINDGDYIYYLFGGSVFLYDTTTQISDSYANASMLKEIEGYGVFVLKDTTLCNLSDGALTEISFSYEDYDNIEDIATGGTAQALSQGESVQTAEIPSGACLIRVDEDYFGDTNFTVLSVTFAEAKTSAQVLYNPDGGNAALIAIGAKTYLTLKDNLTISTYAASTVSASYYLLDGASLYCIPFENEYTKTADIDKDAVVTATGYVSGEAFDYDYYKVEYAADGETLSGYVIANMLTPYAFENDNYESNEIKDGDQSEENNVTTIILVLAIVLLVLIAVGYMIFVATSDKRKRRK